MGSDWRLVQYAGVCMMLLFALVIVLAWMAIESMVWVSVGLTAATVVFVFIFAYHRSTDPLRAVDATYDETFPDIVRGLEQELDVSVRNIYVIDAAQPRAEIRPLVFHRSVDLVVTNELLEVLDPDEVTAIVAHELSHVVYRDHHFRTFSMVLEIFCMYTAGTVAFWVLFEDLPSLVESGLLTSPLDVLSVVVAPLVAAVVIWYAGRMTAGTYRRVAEFAADRRAAAVASRTSMVAALEALEPAQVVGPAGIVEKLVSDYPLMTERIERLESI